MIRDENSIIKDIIAGKINLEKLQESLSTRECARILDTLKKRKENTDQVISDLTKLDGTSSNNTKKRPRKKKGIPVKEDLTIHLSWIDRNRKESIDGEIIAKWKECWLIHGSGRIMAVITCPIVSDEDGPYIAEIKAVVKKTPNYNYADHGFISLEDAQTWCLRTVCGDIMEMDKRLEEYDENEDF